MKSQFLPASLIVLAFSLPVVSATQTKVSDPQALAFAAQSIATLTGGNLVSDITLTGTATWIAGSDTETGTVTLFAKGTSESRVDFSLSGGNRTEIRNSSGNSPQGSWVSTDGISHSDALHNCWTDAVWFYPALSSLNIGGDPNAVLSYAGQEARSGVAVQHLQSYFNFPGADRDFAALTQQASTADFYLDAGTLLPVAITFNAHPDDDATANISVEIDFSNYQSVNGFQVPFHVQRFVQGTLMLDLSLTGAVFNSGLADSIFAIQ